MTNTESIQVRFPTSTNTHTIRRHDTGCGVLWFVSTTVAADGFLPSSRSNAVGFKSEAIAQAELAAAVQFDVEHGGTVVA